jgi:hypothetical protein
MQIGQADAAGSGANNKARLIPEHPLARGLQKIVRRELHRG